VTTVLLASSGRVRGVSSILALPEAPVHAAPHPDTSGLEPDTPGAPVASNNALNALAIVAARSPEMGRRQLRAMSQARRHIHSDDALLRPQRSSIGRQRARESDFAPATRQSSSARERSCPARFGIVSARTLAVTCASARPLARALASTGNKFKIHSLHNRHHHLLEFCLCSHAVQPPLAAGEIWMPRWSLPTAQELP
jgi:hypothetical protein